MYVYVLHTIFQCEFSCDSDYVIRRLYFENIWYGHHQASFFSVNSVMTVIMSSRDYILKIYDMVIIRHHFSVQILLWQWLCHPKTIFWKYMIWLSSVIYTPPHILCQSAWTVWSLSKSVCTLHRLRASPCGLHEFGMSTQTPHKNRTQQEFNHAFNSGTNSSC
jgi:hypothetical protein